MCWTIKVTHLWTIICFVIRNVSISIPINLPIPIPIQIEVSLSLRHDDIPAAGPEDNVWAPVVQKWGREQTIVGVGRSVSNVYRTIPISPIPPSMTAPPSAASQQFSGVDVHRDLIFPTICRFQLLLSSFFRFSNSVYCTYSWAVLSPNKSLAVSSNSYAFRFVVQLT